MNGATLNSILVLGATGKTGSRVAQSSLTEEPQSGGQLALAQISILIGATQRRLSRLCAGFRVCLFISPVMRTDFAGVVSRFLDEAERADVRHITYLSAYGAEHAPAEMALRAVELDLASRRSLSHSILRPAWFMQNFSETFLKPVNDEIAVPCGTGAEAFVSAEDIASVAVVTLSDPLRHAGRAYAPTGPDSLTFEEAARLISIAVARRITYRDVDRNEWIDAMTQAGVPAEYGEVLRALTETVAGGQGSRPNDDVLVATGAAPTRFEEFAVKTAPAWQ